MKHLLGMERNTEKWIMEQDRVRAYVFGSTKGDDEVSTTSRKKNRCTSCLARNSFLVFLLVGIVAGTTLGLCLNWLHKDWESNPRMILYLGYPGEIFMRMLKMTIVPLIVTSLIAGMAAFPSKAAGKLGGYTMLYYISTTVLAVLLGMLLVVILKPGDHYTQRSVPLEHRGIHPADAALDLIR